MNILLTQSIAVATLLLSTTVLATNVYTCPNLLDPNTVLDNWTIVGEIGENPQFVKVALTSTGIGCEYKGQVILMQIGMHYEPYHRQHWHKTGGGVNSLYCTESLTACSFVR